MLPVKTLTSVLLVLSHYILTGIVEFQNVGIRRFLFTIYIIFEALALYEKKVKPVLKPVFLKWFFILSKFELEYYMFEKKYVFAD